MMKLHLNRKIFFLSKIIFFLLFLSFKSYSENSEINKSIVLGSEDAAIKVKIFSSFTCPHCANFHFNVVPELKKEYVDKGNVQLIFIDFPLDQAAFNASKLLHCADKNKQMKLLRDKQE